ncbi:MAG: glycosyltransferase, partial [Deltaproteobacteria bacterium]|nr:glycosyltransferase [Deltaproteobacteria bacterium]
ANPELYVRLHVNERNLGIAGNYNRLVERALDAPWLQILDADDYPLDGYFEALEPALESDADVIVTSMRSSGVAVNAYVTAFERLMRAAGRASVPPQLQILGSATTRSALVYRVAKLRGRPFLEPAFDGSDIIHAAPFLERNLYCPEARLFYRIHENSTMSRQRDSGARYREYVAALAPVRRALHEADYVLRRKIAPLLRLR